MARSCIWKFVSNKQMAFLQSFVSQQLLFLFSKHLDTMSIRRIVSPVKQIFRKFSWNWFHENSAGRGRDRGLYVMKMQILLWWQWKWCFYIQWIILFFSMLKSTYLVCLYVCIYNSNIFFLSIWDFLCGGNFGVPTFEFEFRIRISV